MAALYITSLSPRAGKTMLIAGLGKNWINSGRKVGYLKLVAAGEKKQTPTEDTDGAFVQRLFGLDGSKLPQKEARDIKEAYQLTTQGKDVVLVDGLPLTDSANLINTLDAKVLVVHDYGQPLSGALAQYKALGKRLIGIIVNRVPQRRFAEAQERLRSEIAQSGTKFLGAIPEDRTLATLTVGELATLLEGKILNNADQSSEAVENIMLGALTFDSGPAYFGRKGNKAVIVRGDRPDMQLAALQSAIRALVLSGAAKPMPIVVNQANAKKVPLISAPGDVASLVARLEKLLGESRFSQEQKVGPLVDALCANVDVDYIARQIGLQGR